MATTVGKAGEITLGSMATFRVDGKQVDVANIDGAFYAFNDICTHIGCSLYDGALAGTIVTCPCHGSQFDVTTGAVVNGPARRPIETYPVQLAGDEIQI